MEVVHQSSMRLYECKAFAVFRIDDQSLVAYENIKALSDASLGAVSILGRLVDKCKILVQQVGFREAVGHERRSFTHKFHVPTNVQRQVKLMLCELQHIEPYLKRGNTRHWRHFVSLVSFTCLVPKPMDNIKFRQAYIRDIEMLRLLLLRALDSQDSDQNLI